MTSEKNPLEIYRILPQTNCGQCFLPSCLAFSAAVVSGSKKIADCPFISETRLQEVTPTVVTEEPYEIMRAEKLSALQQQVTSRDLKRLAETVGGQMKNDSLSVSCLGKEFTIDSRGKVTSTCHTHTGLTIPLLGYLVHSRGDNPTGNWVAFRELKGGPPMSALFEQRGEQRLQRLADSHPELFDDLVSMFSGKREKTYFKADISVVLYPLPKLPVLVSYWLPEEDLGSDLTISLDETADRHLPLESIFELCIGMVMMFEKIARMHS